MVGWMYMDECIGMNDWIKFYDGMYMDECLDEFL